MKIDLNKDVPPIFKPLFNNKDRFLILKGSAGSGKSVFATKKLVFRSIYENYPHRHLVLRKVQKDIEESIFSEIKKRIVEWGLKNRLYYRETKSPHKIWLKDSQFIFLGLDDEERVKSISDISSITMEEMTEFSEQDFDQLNLRLRGEKPVYKQTMGMFNPINEDHWIKKRFVDTAPSVPTTFHESIYLDNPYIDQEYKNLLESYKETNELYYKVYCLGEWGVVDKTGKFLFMFDQQENKVPCKYDPSLPVKLSFDFNLEPFATIAYQTPNRDQINIFHQIRLNNSDIYQVCDTIRSHYPNAFYIVTGDRSGYNRTGVVRGKTSYWRIIKEELGLNDSQIRLRTKNLDLVESRVLCNAALKSKIINIDPSCSDLISECTYAKVDERGELIKDRVKNKNDFLDAFRYALDAEWPHLSRSPKKAIN